MQIKTIKNRLDNAEAFDSSVNAALNDGWVLKKRLVLQPHQPTGGINYFHTMLYAELEKPDQDQNPSYEALKAYYERISSLPDCNDCGKKHSCSVVPRPGENTRINCPLWSREKTIKDLDGVTWHQDADKQGWTKE